MLKCVGFVRWVRVGIVWNLCVGFLMDCAGFCQVSGGSWETLGRLLEALGRSWEALGGFLEASKRHTGQNRKSYDFWTIFEKNRKFLGIHLGDVLT